MSSLPCLSNVPGCLLIIQAIKLFSSRSALILYLGLVPGLSYEIDKERANNMCTSQPNHRVALNILHHQSKELNFSISTMAQRPVVQLGGAHFSPELLRSLGLVCYMIVPWLFFGGGKLSKADHT